jgi:hypothetical protein
VVSNQPKRGNLQRDITTRIVDLCVIDLGKLIPSFTVISIVVAATIVLLVILVECAMHIAIRFSIADCIKLLYYYIV